MKHKSDLNLEVQGGEIIVTMPNTNYRAVYHKPIAEPGLIALSLTGREEDGSPITSAQFHARAWIAASNKARKLAWIM